MFAIVFQQDADGPAQWEAGHIQSANILLKNPSRVAG